MEIAASSTYPRMRSSSTGTTSRQHSASPNALRTMVRTTRPPPAGCMGRMRQRLTLCLPTSVAPAGVPPCGRDEGLPSGRRRPGIIRQAVTSKQRRDAMRRPALALSLLLISAEAVLRAFGRSTDVLGSRQPEPAQGASCEDWPCRRLFQNQCDGAGLHLPPPHRRLAVHPVAVQTCRWYYVKGSSGCASSRTCPFLPLACTKAEGPFRSRSRRLSPAPLPHGPPERRGLDAGVNPNVRKIFNLVDLGSELYIYDEQQTALQG